MKKSIQLIYVFTTLGLGQSMAQSQIDYPHCNFAEKLNYSPDSNKELNGEYQLTCSNHPVIMGHYVNGLKSGKWITKTVKGTTIKSAEYIEGKLNGKYELFHFNGTPKLIATFNNGQHDGLWQYFNEKGKIIKT